MKVKRNGMGKKGKKELLGWKSVIAGQSRSPHVLKVDQKVDIICISLPSITLKEYPIQPRKAVITYSIFLADRKGYRPWRTCLHFAMWALCGSSDESRLLIIPREEAEFQVVK